MVLILSATADVAPIIGSRWRWATSRWIEADHGRGRMDAHRLERVPSARPPMALSPTREARSREPSGLDPHAAQHAVSAEHIVKEGCAHMHANTKDQPIGREPMPMKGLRRLGIILRSQYRQP